MLGITKETVEKQQEALNKISYFLQGNQAAIDYVLGLNYVVELWDDLVDRDKERSDDEINAAFRISLLDIPTNPFFCQHAGQLVPLQRHIYLAWHDSNVLAKGNEHDRHMAFMLKQELTRIVNYCAWIIGGDAWARMVGADISRMFEEPLDAYMKETEKEA